MPGVIVSAGTVLGAGGGVISAASGKSPTALYGLVVFLFLAMGCFVLFRSMSHHLRKARTQFNDGAGGGGDGASGNGRDGASGNGRDGASGNGRDGASGGGRQAPGEGGPADGEGVPRQRG